MGSPSSLGETIEAGVRAEVLPSVPEGAKARSEELMGRLADSR